MTSHRLLMGHGGRSPRAIGHNLPRTPKVLNSTTDAPRGRHFSFCRPGRACPRRGQEEGFTTETRRHGEEAGVPRIDGMRRPSPCLRVSVVDCAFAFQPPLRRRNEKCCHGAYIEHSQPDTPKSHKNTDLQARRRNSRDGESGSRHGRRQRVWGRVSDRPATGRDRADDLGRMT